MATYSPADAYQDRLSVELGRFRSWAGPSANLWLGEFGVPNNKGTEQAQWNAAQAFALARVSKDNINVTTWATGLWWGTYELLYYNPSMAPQANAATFEQYFNRSGLLTGINFAGGEFAHGPAELNNNSTLAQLDNYIQALPTQANLQALKNRGVQIIRLPIRWERLQTTFMGALRPTWVTAINNVLTAANNVGMKVMIDVHNYAVYNYNGAAVAIRTGAVTQAAYNDFLLRLCAAFASHPGFHSLDTMNEPSGVSASLWEQISGAAYDAVRAVYPTVKLHIELGNWAGIQELPSKHASGPWRGTSDPNLYYHGHYYPEADHSGSGFGTYASEVSAATSAGFRAASTAGTFVWDGSTSGGVTPPDPNPSSTTITSSNNVEAAAMQRAIAWTTWLNGKQGFIGEYGIPWHPADDGTNTEWPVGEQTNWKDMANKWYTIMNDKSVHATPWATGNHWGSYAYSMYDDSGASYVRRWNADPFVNTANNGRSNADTSTYRRGYNIAGAEFGFNVAGDGGDHSADNLTRNWTDSYGTRYPTLSDFQFFASEGMKLCRVPFRAEKVFVTKTTTTMNTTELNAIKAMLDNANTAGCKVVLDMHNYANYLSGASFPFTDNKLGAPGGWNVTDWCNQWVALMNAIKDKPALLAIDLMNEPSQNYVAGASPTMAQKGAAWQANTTACVTALRNAGWTGVICVPTAEWSGVHQVTQLHPSGPWINDSNIWWESHQYWDANADGITNTSENWAAINSAYSGTPAQSYTTGGSVTTITAPSGMTPTANSSTQITVNWTDNSNNETGFQVERKTGTGAFAQVGQVAAGVTTYVDSNGLTPSTTYTYRVRAFNATTTSDYTPEASATTSAAATIPAAPTGPSATTLSSTSIRFQWNDTSTNETGFSVWRRTDTVGWVEVATPGVNATQYIDTGLSPNTRYYYRVRSYNAVGTSNYTTEIFSTTNPSEAPTTDRANLIFNPGFEANVTDNTVLENFTTGTAPVMSRDTTSKYVGTGSLKIVLNSAPEPDNWRVKLKINSTNLINFVAGRTYFLSFAVKSSDARSISAFFEETGGVGDYPFAPFPTSTDWSLVQLTYTPTVTRSMYLGMALNTGSAATVQLDAFLLEENASSFGSYFDGSYGTDYSWAGAANNSMSIYTASTTEPGPNGQPPELTTKLVEVGRRIGLIPMLRRR